MSRDPTEGPRLVVSPSRTVVGTGAVEHAGKYAALYGERALVVATEQIHRIHGARLEGILEDAGVPCETYTEVRPDPTIADVEAAYERYREGDCDVIVTLGGGSSIDAGKAVGILAGNDGEIREFGVDRAGYEGVPEPIPPLVAVNTTAGTGSEATRSVVLTDADTDTKFLIVSENVVPTVAIEDPELVTSLPRSHTAFTGIDALTHAIEAFVSVNAWAIPDDFARNAIRRLDGSLRKAWANGEDVEARTGTLIGQLQAGQAFTNSSVALVHGMARPLGAQLHLPHGLANAVLLPYVMEFSAMGAPEKYAEVARLLGAADAHTPDREAARLASDAVFELCSELGLYDELESFGEIPDRETYLGLVERMADDAIESGSPANNPRKPTREEIEELYVRVYDDALAPEAPRRSDDD